MCALAGLTLPPLRISVDLSWQKALSRSKWSKGYISPEYVSPLRDNKVTRTPQNEARGPLFLIFNGGLGSMHTPCIASQ